MVHSTWLQNHFEIYGDIRADIQEMVKEKGKTCISIIVPTRRTGKDRIGDRIEVEKSRAVC